MTVATSSETQTLTASHEDFIRTRVESAVDAVMASLPNPEDVSADQRLGILARYTAVLEGNFIYWMTGAYLAVKSDDSRAIILDNLHEEVRDCHPGMLRRFALAAHALPTDQDAMAVYEELSKVRLFIGRLSGVPMVVMMAYFEGFIQKFMAYLADLAAGRGSVEREYTDVHGVCDIAHTAGLFRAIDAEMLLNPPEAGTDLFEGVELLSALLHRIIDGPNTAPFISTSPTSRPHAKPQ